MAQLNSYKKKLLIAIPIVLVFSLVAGFVGYAGYYSSKQVALPGIKVAHIPVTGLTKTEIEQRLNEAENKLQVNIKLPNGNTESVSLSDTGYQVNAAAMADKAINENSAISNYFSALFTTHNIDPIFTIDSVKLAKLVSKYSEYFKGGKPPVEPKIEFNKEQKKFVSIPGKAGTGIDGSQITDAAEAAFKAHKNQEIELKTAETVKPITSDSVLAKDLANANGFLSRKVTVTAAGKSFSPNESDLASFVKLPTYPSNDGIEVNNEAVTKWINSIASQVTRKPVDWFYYVNSSGQRTRTVHQGVDGVKVVGQSQAVAAIVADLKADKDATTNLKTETDKAPVKTKTIADGAEKLAYPAAPGEYWIDVNLTKHQLTAYRGATPIFGPYVIIDGKAGWETVTGTYHVYLKYRSQRMTGPGYDTPGVPWVMYWHGDYAIHGAPWRTSKLEWIWSPTRGSHGCVNLHTEVAKKLWEMTPIGTPVVSHY